MSNRINTNVDAFTAQRNLSMTGTTYSKSVQKLSSGLRINSASDDAAGLAISEKLRAQIRGLAQAQRNSQDGISMIQTGEGAMNETTSMLQRMRELAVQAANDTLSSSDRTSINTELQQLQSEINGVASRTKFNGQGLLSGSMVTAQSGGSAIAGAQFNTTGGNSSIRSVDVSGAQAGKTYTLSSSAAGTLTLTRSGDNVAQTITLGATGANSQQVLSFASLGVSLTVDTDGAGKTANGLATDLATKTITTGAGASSANFQIGSNASDSISVAFSKVDLSGTVGGDGKLDGLATALSTFNTTQSVANAQSLITNIDNAIDAVNTQRANLGAYQNRLEHTIANLGVAQENLTASESRIRDVDMAAEMVNFTKTGILQQAGQAILAQANQAPGGIVNLLRG
jgi:flagellin